MNLKTFYWLLFLLFIQTTKSWGQLLLKSTGSGNFYNITYPAQLTTIPSGFSFIFQADKTNSGPVSINVNLLGNRSVLKNVNQPLAAGDIVVDQSVFVFLDGNGNWQLMNPKVFQDLWTANGSSIYYNGGRVGIGTSTPNALLHVMTTAGNASINIDAPSAGFASLGFSKAGATEWGIEYLPSGLLGISNASFGGYPIVIAPTSGNMGFGAFPPLDAIHLGGGKNLRIESLASTGTGIATLNTLGVLGRLALTGNVNHVLRGDGTVGLPTVFTPWVASGSDIYYNAGEVAIGHTLPNYLLDIRSGSNTILNISSSTAGLNTMAGLRLSMYQSYTGAQYYLYSEKTDAVANSGNSDFIIRKDFSTGGGWLKFFRFNESNNNVVINDSKTTASAFGNLILANGSLGIGIATPSNPITVNTSNTSGIVVQRNGVFSKLYISDLGENFLEASSIFKIDPNGGGTMFSIDDGNTYIYNQFTVNNSSNSRFISTFATTTFSVNIYGISGGGPRIGFSDGSNTVNAYYEVGAYGGTNNHDTKNRNWQLYSFSATNPGISFIAASGNVGIGTNVPTTKLQVDGTITGTPIGTIRNYASTTSQGLQVQLGATGSTTNATTYSYIIFRRGDNTTVGSVAGNGTTGVTYNTTSDRRLKTNFQSISDPWAILNKLNPLWYEWKEAPKKVDIGFVAQDVQKVYPYAVSGDSLSNPSTNPMMIDYSKFAPLLTAGLKDHESNIQSLKKDLLLIQKENQTLKVELVEIKKQLEQLKGKK